MKSSTIGFFFGILIISIGIAWILTGGPAPSPDIPAAPVTAAVPAVTSPAPLPTQEVVATTTTPVAVQTSAPVPAISSRTPTPVVTTATPPSERLFSADQVRDHFIDIAYSANNKLDRINYTESQKPLIISIIAPDDSDAVVLSAAAKEFNDASRTNKISENIKESDKGDIVIRFLPESGLSSIGGTPDREFTTDGRTVAKILGTSFYISSNLKGDARNHTIVRCLFYGMGVTGETTEYPDSLFYSGENANTRLNTIDKKALALLYEPGLYQGMTMENLKKVMYIP